MEAGKHGTCGSPISTAVQTSVYPIHTYINKDIAKDQLATGQVSPIESKHTLVLGNAAESQDSLLLSARLDRPIRPPPTALVMSYAQDVKCTSL